MLEEEEDSDCGDNDGVEEDGVASQCLDIEEDHMGEIEELLLLTAYELESPIQQHANQKS